MDSLVGRLSTRFLVVSVIPMALLVGYIGFLLAAGAPQHRPSLGQAITILNELTLRQIAVLIAILLVLSVATHPLQIPLIQLAEGYWWRLPAGLIIANRAVERFKAERRMVRTELRQIQNAGPREWLTDQFAARALRRQYWLPTLEKDLLPTELGNTLRAGEVRAGARYGLELAVAMPRLVSVLDSASLAELRDRRNQLDAAVQLCMTAGLATAVGIGLLVWHGGWLYLPLLTYAVCWMSYAAAVAAARGFCNSLAAAVDLHHLKLFDALQLERPADLSAEFTRNQLLNMLFRGDAMSEVDKKALRYSASSATDQTTDESG